MLATSTQRVFGYRMSHYYTINRTRFAQYETRPLANIIMDVSAYKKIEIHNISIHNMLQNFQYHISRNEGRWHGRCITQS